MACDPLRPTPQALFDFLKGSFETNVLAGGIVRPASPEWYVLANDYKVAEHLLSMTARMWKERDPRYACCDNLVDMASGVDGVHPRAATFAEGYVTLTGTAGATLSAASLQINFNGAYYRVANPSTVPATMPATGTITLRYRAVQPGPVDTVPTTGTTGLLVAPVPNVDRTVTVSGGRFCNGKDSETCEAFRTRYLNRLRYRPNLNYSLLEEAALAWPCVTRICERACCPVDEQVCGTRPLMVHAIFDDTFENGIAPANILAEMTDAIFGLPQGEGRGVMPIGVCGEFVPLTACQIDVTYTGLACATEAQQKLIRERTTALFKNLCPGKILCVRQFVGVVAQVAPDVCNFDVILTPLNDCLELSACGDVLPACDVLPVLGSITIG